MARRSRVRPWSKVMKKQKTPIHETVYICTALALVSGFLEAYTYLLKGGIFANAQTGNFALMGIAIAGGQFGRALTYLIPMCFYVAGIALTVTMPRLLDDRGLVRWDTVFVFFEIVLLFIIGLLPKTVPFTVSTVAVAFICAMQYNTFKRVNNVSFSSTFCTNNLRQLALHLMDYIRTKEKSSLQNSFSYMLINASFLLGAVIGAFCAKRWAEKSVWFCCAVLTPVLFALIFGRRTVEKELRAEELEQISQQEQALEQEKQNLLK